MPAIRLPCVMLAREGSKRLPGKNRLDWEGEPLYQHALREAEKCAVVSRVDLVTDMIGVGISHGHAASRLHFKPMPDEHTSIEGVNWWREQADLQASYCLLIQCTSPFINPGDLDRLVQAAFADGLPTEVWALGDPMDTHPKLLEKGIRGRPSGMAWVIPPLATDTLARRFVRQRAPLIDIDTAEDYDAAQQLWRQQHGAS